MSMIEYALNADPRHGEYRSVMSQLHTCTGSVAVWTGMLRGVRVLFLVGTMGRLRWSTMFAAMRHHERREASIIPLSHAVAKE